MIIHHSSNRFNCSLCMDLWIAEENARTLQKQRQTKNLIGWEALLKQTL